MQLSTIMATILASAALNMAMPLADTTYVPCTGVQSNAICVSTDLLGNANLNSANRTLPIHHVVFHSLLHRNA